MDTQSSVFTVEDDFTFPATRRGQALSGVLESATEKPKTSPDAVEVFARQQARTQAMSAVLAWIEDGEYSYNALDEYIIGMADLDGDFEISDEEEAAYNAIWAEVPDALLSLGATEADTTAFVNGDGKDADDAGARVGKAAKEALDDLEADDDELIAGFPRTGVLSTPFPAYREMVKRRFADVKLAQSRLDYMTALYLRCAGYTKPEVSDELARHSPAPSSQREKNIRVFHEHRIVGQAFGVAGDIDIASSQPTPEQILKFNHEAEEMERERTQRERRAFRLR